MLSHAILPRHFWHRDKSVYQLVLADINSGKLCI